MTLLSTIHFVRILIISLLISGCTERNKEHLLFDSESDHELDQLYWQCKTIFSISDEHATHGKHSLKMNLYPSDYPGISFKLTRRDWRGYSTLAVDIYNPQGVEIPITIRIDDHKDANNFAERFNHSIRIHPGQNRIRIPLSSVVTSGTHKPLNLKTITSLMIFIVNPRDMKTLYLDYVRIEP